MVALVEVPKVWPWMLAGVFVGSCMTCWLVSYLAKGFFIRRKIQKIGGGLKNFYPENWGNDPI